MPFAIENVRITDLTWLLAGAGGPRMLASLGAEDIRVEWKDRLDVLRHGNPTIPIGKDRERVLNGETVMPQAESINQGGHFAGINAGKRGISLNLRTPKGKELFKEIVRISDIVVECFTAPTMKRLELDYDVLRKINPSLIYIQQPGFGKKGHYVDYVSTGPVAQAISGLSEQSGLPDPYPPAGWGYSYMDWSGAYYCGMAMLSALYYRARTGQGQYMDCSQAEPAIYMTGTAVLDYMANGRHYQRTGNRSPYVPAAPHGAYRCQGTDRWIAIAVSNDDEWRALAGVLGDPGWTKEDRFKTMASRLARQDDLDGLMNDATQAWDPWELTEKLQAAGVAAGACQTAEERMFRDPQLKHRGFQTMLNNSFVGEWQVKDFPVKLSESPAYVGGTLDRGFPCYGEDNDYVYGTLLGMPKSDQEALADEEVI
ncbi:MAG: CoA transferase [Chloroflexi bacterium]|nr:CoA transferase [Chloroflexota bacterium]